jgi:hypothetical protein
MNLWAFLAGLSLFLCVFAWSAGAVSELFLLVPVGLTALYYLARIAVLLERQYEELRDEDADQS